MDVRWHLRFAEEAFAGIDVPAERTALNTAERVGYIAVTLRRDERDVSHFAIRRSHGRSSDPRLDVSWPEFHFFSSRSVTGLLAQLTGIGQTFDDEMPKIRFCLIPRFCLKQVS
jgi:hypothetical protein